MSFLPDTLFSLSCCIFCTRDCRSGAGRCRNSVWDDDQKKKVSNLVFSRESLGGFRTFFWHLILGSYSEKPLQKSVQENEMCEPTNAIKSESIMKCEKEEAHHLLPVCTSCLETVVIIKKLHSDLEKIQMLLIENVSRIQRSVAKSEKAELKDKQLPDLQLNALSEFQAQICRQSGKAIKIPLLFLDRYSCNKLPGFNVNVVKKELDEIQNAHASMDQEDDNWSPPPSPSDEDSEDSIECNVSSLPKKRVGRPRKENSQKLTVNVPRKENSHKRPVGRPRKHGFDDKPLSKEVSTSKTQEKSSNPKKLYRLIIRKNKWKPKSATEGPVGRKNHFHKSYLCEICNKKYCKWTAFLKHKRAHEEYEVSMSLDSKDEENKKCSVCHLEVHCSSYYEHLLSHEDKVGNNMNNDDCAKPFACTHKDCIRKFNIEENLKIHMEFDHDEISSAACLLQIKKCDVCNICYETSGDLLEHFKNAHEEKYSNLYYCPVCAHSYSVGENLISHMHSHKTKDQQVCFICKAGSLNRSELLAHFEQMHNLRTKRDCDICQETFDDIYLYNFHLKSVHKRQETFICSFCGKICYFPVSFTRHLSMHKRLERIGLLCEMCNSKFATEDMLSSHRIKIHGAPKLQCIHCDSQLLTPSALSSHMKIHKEDCFICQICGKKFSQKGNLVQHSAIHTNERSFTCENCGFTCKTKLILERHLSTHTKKFSCNVCGRKFSRKHALNTHFKMHTGETIVCSYCGYEFHSRKSWKRHVKTYHESDSPLPLYRPQKTRRACVHWKDSEGNVHYAKNVKPAEEGKKATVQSMGSITEQIIPEQGNDDLSTIDVKYEVSNLPV